MKGIVYVILQKMIEQTNGLRTWDKIVTEEKLDSGGIYTAADTYKDEEVFKIVGALSRYTGAAVREIVKAFGRYLFRSLAAKYPHFCHETSLKPFLLSVESVIHKEVSKLYPGAVVPQISYRDEGENGLTMFYKSKRKLCLLAEGLIEGASEHFQQPVEIVHSRCMHQGAECCELQLKIAAASVPGSRPLNSRGESEAA